MSQEKVDRYKEEKKNRKKIMAREKRNARLANLGVSLIAVALVAWLGVSIYQNATNNTTETETEAYTVDTSALDDYIASISND